MKGFFAFHNVSKDRGWGAYGFLIIFLILIIVPFSNSWILFK